MVPVRVGVDDVVNGPDLSGKEDRCKDRSARIIFTFVGAAPVDEYPCRSRPRR